MHGQVFVMDCADSEMARMAERIDSYTLYMKSENMNTIIQIPLRKLAHAIYRDFF